MQMPIPLNAPSDPKDVRGAGYACVVAGAVLIVAATLKGHQLITDPPLMEGFLGSWWHRVGVVAIELLLGTWLWSGRWADQARQIALACFAAFFVLNLFKGARGEASCGCFGKVGVSPWLTAILDLGICVALTLWRPGPTTAAHSPAWDGCVATFAVGVVGLGTWAALRYQPATVSDEGNISDAGPVVRLDPQSWVDRPFPLLMHIDIGALLGRGDWIVVLYRRDCPHCQEELRKYGTDTSGASTDARSRVALIEVPSRGNASFSADNEVNGCVRGRLTGDREWLVRVPVVLTVRDGRVTAIGEGGGVE